MNLGDTDIITAQTIEKLANTPNICIKTFKRLDEDDLCYLLHVELIRHDIHAEFIIKDKNIFLYANLIKDTVESLIEQYEYMHLKITKGKNSETMYIKVFDVYNEDDNNYAIYGTTVRNNDLLRKMNMIDLEYNYWLSIEQRIFDGEFIPLFNCYNIYTYIAPRYRYKYTYDSTDRQLLIGRFSYDLFQKPALIQIHMNNTQTESNIHEKIGYIIEHIENDLPEKYQGKLIYLEDEDYITNIQFALIIQKL